MGLRPEGSAPHKATRHRTTPAVALPILMSRSGMQSCASSAGRAGIGGGRKVACTYEYAFEKFALARTLQMFLVIHKVMQPELSASGYPKRCASHANVHVCMRRVCASDSAIMGEHTPCTYSHPTSYILRWIAQA